MKFIYHTCWETNYTAERLKNGKREKFFGKIDGKYEPVKLTRSLRRSMKDETILVRTVDPHRVQYRFGMKDFKEMAEIVNTSKKGAIND